MHARENTYGDMIIQIRSPGLRIQHDVVRVVEPGVLPMVSVEQADATDAIGRDRPMFDSAGLPTAVRYVRYISQCRCCRLRGLVDAANGQ